MTDFEPLDQWRLTGGKAAVGLSERIVVVKLERDGKKIRHSQRGPKLQIKTAFEDAVAMWHRQYGD